MQPITPITPRRLTKNDQQPQQKPDFIFPVLSKSDVVQCLNQLNFQVTGKDLDNPKPELMSEIYEKFVEVLMGISREEMHQPQFNLIKELDYPQLYDEACGQVLFITSLMKLFSIIGVEGFSLNTLIRPNKKTRKYLSGLINYAKFHESKISTVSSLAEETDQLLEQKNMTMVEINKLESQIDDSREEKEREAPMISEMKEEVTQKMVNLRNVDEVMKKRTEEAKNVKDEFTAMQEKVKAQKESVVRLKEEIKQLKAQIVSSPDTTVKTLEELRMQTNLEKKKLADDYTKVKALNHKKGELADISRDLEKCLLAVKDCRTLHEGINHIKNEKENITVEIYNKEKKREELKRATTVLKEHITNKEKAIGRGRRNLDGDIKKRRELEKKAKSLLQREEKRKIASQETLDQRQEELRLVYEEVERMKNMHNKDVMRYRKMYLLIISRFENYVSDVSNELENDFEGVEI